MLKTILQKQIPWKSLRLQPADEGQWLSNQLMFILLSSLKTSQLVFLCLNLASDHTETGYIVVQRILVWRSNLPQIFSERLSFIQNPCDDGSNCVVVLGNFSHSFRVAHHPGWCCTSSRLMLHIIQVDVAHHPAWWCVCVFFGSL